MYKRSFNCNYCDCSTFKATTKTTTTTKTRWIATTTTIVLNRTTMMMIIMIISITTTRLPLVRSERAYPLGCSTKGSKYYDFESMPFPPTTEDDIPIKTTDDYMLVRRLGAGKFSDVFEAVDVQLEQQQQQQSMQSAAAAAAAGGVTSTSTSSTISTSMNSSIDPRTLVVLKCLKPVAERKIKRELLVLQHASKLPNLARILAVVIPPDYSSSSSSSSTGGSSNNINNNNHNDDNHTNNKKFQLQSMPSLVLEHAGVDSQWLCHPKAAAEGQDVVVVENNNNNNQQNQQLQYYLSDEEMKYYLYHLLIALDNLHAAGIMHRDVKPRNVLIDRINRSLMLIDLGLADFYLPNTNYNVRVASRHYKSPELLLGYEGYDYAIDMWGVGCILAGLLLRREPVFRGKDNMDQLGKIVSVLGTADLHAYISKTNIEMTTEIRKVIAKCTLRGGTKKEWLSLASSDYTPTAEALDLLSKLLVYDHEIRLTAKQAMRHSFFDSVRDTVERQILQQQQQLQLQQQIQQQQQEEKATMQRRTTTTTTSSRGLFGLHETG